MVTADNRAGMLTTLIERAENDPDISGAVLLGSSAAGTADRWSDLDVAFAVARPARAADVAERWTAALATEPGVVHHWDLPVRETALIRVFLLPDGLELDLSFYPEDELVRRGPSWRPLFGDFGDDEDWTDTSDPAAVRQTIGLTWHHVLHARTCIERGRAWQAEHWIAQARAHLVALACHRLGYPTMYAKGAHLLPAEATEPLLATLVGSLETAELRRALAAVADAFDRELRRQDEELADRLLPVLTASLSPSATAAPGPAGASSPDRL